jgi:glycosyltransferase involved in cell wall biosynthesis
MSDQCPKVSFFMPGLYGGGAEDVVLKLAGGFSSRDVSVDLVVVKSEGELQVCVPSNVNLVDLDSDRIATSLVPLIRYIRRARPRVLISTLTPTNVISTLANIAAGWSTVNVLTEQNTKSTQLERRNLRARLFTMAAKFTYGWANQIIAASNRIADDLCSVVQFEREKIEVIHNPVFTEEIHRKANEEVDHPWFRSDVEVLLGVGRLTPQKDFPTLIRTVARLREDRDVRLILLGEGEERSHLQDLCRELGIADHVDLHGFVDNPIKYMARSDVFVLSSAWEGFGIVVVEALASGAPVVSTCGDEGPGEILRDGRYGRLVSTGDDKALAEAILKTLNHSDQPATEEERIRRARDFSVEAAVEKYWSIVEQYV